MADLKLDTIEGRTSGTITEVGDLKYQIATAWVFLDGKTVSINDSYNVSSVTDVATGEYRANFSVTMDNANYAVSGVVGDNSSVNAHYGIMDNGNASDGHLVASFQFRVTTGSSGVDLDRVSIMFFGGKN